MNMTSSTCQSSKSLPQRYRPQTFDEVVGQDAVVTTLRNALKQQRLAPAYLFAGSHGTGKTSLARLLAKAMNCEHRVEGVNPCNQCSSCEQIGQSSSLDVLEIDGASHRGIEDIRQLNETVGYAPANGRHKVYLIDEVHMLTKEAFNALLKTLEEPPSHVTFIFATTEPQKVLPTILSRCQRFHLTRLSSGLITDKLVREAKEIGVEVDEEALALICQRADGSMRDAESLLDQLISFHGSSLDGALTARALGIVPRSLFFRLDEAAHRGDLAAAFTIAAELSCDGQSVMTVLEGLLDHYRLRLRLHLGVSLDVSPKERELYQKSAKQISKDQCLLVLDELLASQESFKGIGSPSLGLEILMLKIVRLRNRLPIDHLVERLLALEERLGQPATPPPPKPVQPPPPHESQGTAARARYHTAMRFAAVELEGTLS